MIWFTSDTHFGHLNIMKYCKRPFKSIEEHDEELIRRWNERVKPNDTVYHLGDFAWFGPLKCDEYLSRLNGFKHLILGNHDRMQRMRKTIGWESIQPYLEIKIDNQQAVMLFHYRMVVWNKKHYGSWALHGHSHGTLPLSGDYTLDVGVDCWDYYPISVEIIREAFKLTKKIREVTYDG